ncbi:MAG TPA: hypothetical protein VGG71_00005 [Chitinophagaceae bacterium]|jgi:hypothetical protein
MKKIIILFLFFFTSFYSFSQYSKKIAGYLSFQYNKALSDRTLPNNPWGMGLGFQMLFNNHAQLKAVVDLSADAYLEDDKVLRMNANGTEIPTVSGLINLFIGPSYQPIKAIAFSFVGGPSFVSNEVLLGLKPSLDFYFPKTQKWTAKIYYLYIPERDKTTKQDFRSAGFSIGVNLF